MACLFVCLTFLMVMHQALAQGYQGYPGYQGPSQPQCPRVPPECICPQDYNPVCSTLGCTYSNLCQLSCANDTFAYNGRCRRPHGGYGYGGYRTAPAPAQSIPVQD